MQSGSPRIGRWKKLPSGVSIFVTFEILWDLLAVATESAVENGLARRKQNNGGQRIGSGCMNNIMCVEVLTGLIIQLGCHPWGQDWDQESREVIFLCICLSPTDTGISVQTLWSSRSLWLECKQKWRLFVSTLLRSLTNLLFQLVTHCCPQHLNQVHKCIWLCCFLIRGIAATIAIAALTAREVQGSSLQWEISVW